MSWTKTGECPKCGAPIYAPMIWHAVTPPPSHYTCDCNQATNGTVTTTTSGSDAVPEPDGPFTIDGISKPTRVPNGDGSSLLCLAVISPTGTAIAWFAQESIARRVATLLNFAERTEMSMHSAAADPTKEIQNGWCKQRDDE